MNTTEIANSGVEKPVEILMDHWGIPHIYAQSYYDAFFAQGFNAARDRLWQIDLWRRRGLGKLSEVLGQEYVEQDKASRMFLYRGNMEKEWKAYGNNTKKIVSSFVSGINAYIDVVADNSDSLPQEFNILGYKPEKWNPEDVVQIRSHGLIRNAQNEVERALTLREYGEDVERVRQRLEPHCNMKVPEGLDLQDIPKDVLDVYSLAKQEVYFDDAQKKVKNTSLNDKIKYESDLGSNNWVLSPSKSKTGRPILANDPHRTLTVPSLRYIAHLCAPGLNVIGGGEPALPGISIGHNERVGYGLTIFAIDQEDLYVYETNPTNSSEYLYDGKWKSMNCITEKIKIKGDKERTVNLEFTQHGPVVYKDEKNNRAFAIRSVWLEPGTAPYLGSLSYMNAQNWDEFYKAMNGWGTPSENQVYADIDGNIGWKPGGMTPIRKTWNGLLPVPGDGRYEWDGFLDQEKLPSMFNPLSGWIATANNMNLPEDYPYQKYKLGFEWTAPFRVQRIKEVIARHEKLGIDECLRLQTDYLSIPARRIIAQLTSIDSKEPKMKEALNMLINWNKELSVDSSPAALFEVWYQYHLQKAIVEKLVPKEAADDIETGDPVVVLRQIEYPDERFGNNPEKTRDEILLSSLKDAVKHTESLLGPEMKNWEWGDLHYSFLEHSLSKAEIVNRKRRNQLNVGPHPRGGDKFTVGNTGYNEDFQQTSGSTYRMVLDVGNWDNSVVMNSPGQSGDPSNKHYDDLFHNWVTNQSVPMLYSYEKIKDATEERFILLPILD